MIECRVPGLKTHLPPPPDGASVASGRLRCVWLLELSGSEESGHHVIMLWCAMLLWDLLSGRKNKNRERDQVRSADGHPHLVSGDACANPSADPAPSTSQPDFSRRVDQLVDTSVVTCQLGSVTQVKTLILPRRRSTSTGLGPTTALLGATFGRRTPQRRPRDAEPRYAERNRWRYPRPLGLVTKT